MNSKLIQYLLTAKDRLKLKYLREEAATLQSEVLMCEPGSRAAGQLLEQYVREEMAAEDLSMKLTARYGMTERQKDMGDLEALGLVGVLLAAIAAVVIPGTQLLCNWIEWLGVVL